MRYWIVLATLTSVGLWGCGDDSSTDAGTDTSVPVDSAMDTSTMDAMPDGMADATPDGMMDAMPDGSGDGGDGGVGDGGDAGDAGDAGYDPVARGDYLVNHVWTCGDCHSPRGADFMFIPGMRLSGNSGLVPDLHIPNITPHMTTGIGAWTDTELRNAIVAGIDRDGNRMSPFMPYWMLRNLTAEDVDAIIAYLRSVPPVDNTIPEMPDFPNPVTPIRDADIPLPTLPTSDPDYATAMDGRYLSLPCMECHTPENMTPGEPPLDLTQVFAGGRLFPLPDGMGGTLDIYSPNITQGTNGTELDTITRIQDFLTSSLEGCLVMPLGPEGYWGLTDADANAIATYIFHLPNQDTAAPTPMCPVPMP